MSPVRISVWCEDAYHEGEPEFVKTYIGTPITGRAWTWTESAVEVVQRGRTDVATLVGDELQQPPEVFDLDAVPVVQERNRHRISCRCGVTVPVRAEKLEPILTQLAQHAVTRVDLGRLAAILTK